MFNIRISLLIVFFLSIINFFYGQGIFDTIYFNKKWEKSNKDKAKYYRLSYKKDSLFYVSDYYHDGLIQMTGTYSSLEPEIKDGVFIWYWRNGKKKVSGSYISNKKEGIWKDFYYDEIISNETYYQNGMKNGTEKDFRFNGNLWCIYRYKNDSLNGMLEYWKKNGDIDFVCEYKNNKVFNSGDCGLYGYFYFVSKTDSTSFLYSKEYIEKNISLDYLQYFKNGRPHYISYFNLDDSCSYFVKYYRNGKLKYRKISGVKDEKLDNFWRNGNVKKLDITSNDKKDELFKKYYKNGNIKRELDSKHYYRWNRKGEKYEIDSFIIEKEKIFGQIVIHSIMIKKTKMKIKE